MIPLHHLPLPGGGEAVLRSPTIGDLETVGAELHKLVPRCLRSIDGQPVDEAAIRQMRFTDYNAVAAYLQSLRDPTAEDVAHVGRERRGHEVLVTLPTRATVLLEEPTVEAYHTCTDYGRAGLPGGLRLLRRCIREIDGKPRDYAALSAAWPFSVPETLLLHAELVALCSESADSVRAREGKVRVVG